MKYFALIFFFVFSAFAHRMEYKDSIADVVFETEDFLQADILGEKSNGKIEPAAGWGLGCEIKTPHFHAPENSVLRLQASMEVAVAWDAFISDSRQLIHYELARIDVVYEDQLGFRQSQSRFLIAQEFGEIASFAKSNSGATYYGGSEQARLIELGTYLIPKGSKKITFEICRIAPRTMIRVGNIKARISTQ